MVNVGLDEFTVNSGAGDGEFGRVSVDADHTRTVGFEASGEAAGATPGVAHIESVDRADRVEEQVVLDPARVPPHGRSNQSS